MLDRFHFDFVLRVTFLFVSFGKGSWHFQWFYQSNPFPTRLDHFKKVSSKAIEREYLGNYDYGTVNLKPCSFLVILHILAFSEFSCGRNHF